MTEESNAERIAKRLSRAGVASRRDAEKMITAGRVAVNGTVLASPAMTVTPQDRVTVDGKLVSAPEPPRLWRFHKPRGTATTARDEKDRRTIYDVLPDDLPRTMPVGRLDMNSEGLLLLTNDGELKRRLELPFSGWLRTYRVRAQGSPTDSVLQPLSEGITIDGVSYQPMLVRVDSRQGANCWMTIGLREGKNREIRRALEHIGMAVNRLIRVGYGPFVLGKLAPGGVEELRGRAVSEALGKSQAGWAKPGEAPKSPQPRRTKVSADPSESLRGRARGKPSGAKPGSKSPSGGGKPTRRDR